MNKRVLLGLVMGACLVVGDLACVSHWGNYNAGLSDEEALARALGRSIDDFEEEELQRAIRESLRECGASETGGASEPGSASETGATAASTGSANSTQETCSICLDKYDANSQVTTLPCGHSFCTGCINRWFEEDDTCPICRKRFSLNHGLNVSRTTTVVARPEPSYDIDSDLAIAQLLQDQYRDDAVVRREADRVRVRGYRRLIEKPSFLQRVRNFLGL